MNEPKPNSRKAPSAANDAGVNAVLANGGNTSLGDSGGDKVFHDASKTIAADMKARWPSAFGQRCEARMAGSMISAKHLPAVQPQEMPTNQIKNVQGLGISSDQQVERPQANGGCVGGIEQAHKRGLCRQISSEAGPERPDGVDGTDPNQSQKKVMHSRSLFGLGEGGEGCATDDGPVHVGAKVFTAFAGQCFDVGTSFGGHLVQAPLVDNLMPRQVEKSGQRSHAASLGNGSFERGVFSCHAQSYDRKTIHARKSICRMEKCPFTPESRPSAWH